MPYRWKHDGGKHLRNNFFTRDECFTKTCIISRISRIKDVKTLLLLKFWPLKLSANMVLKFACRGGTTCTCFVQRSHFVKLLIKDKLCASFLALNPMVQSTPFNTNGFVSMPMGDSIM